MKRDLTISERALGSDHPEVATSLNILALLYNDQGKYEEAEPLYQRALAIRERGLGSDHPDTANSLYCLAFMYSRKGEYEQSEAFYLRTLKIYVKTLPPEHPNIAAVLDNYASLLRKMHRIEEASKLEQRSREIRSKRFLHRQNNVDGIDSGAIFDVNGRYRYSLWRAWSAYHPRIVFVLLNPSTADEQKNDPTILRCIGFARAWNFGSIEVVNLFAYMATDYRELFKESDPVGEENNSFLMQAVERCSTVVVGWGTRGTLLGRDLHVMSLLAGRKNVYCLGITKDGLPRHPLYVKGDTSLVSFEVGFSTVF